MLDGHVSIAAAIAGVIILVFVVLILKRTYQYRSRRHSTILLVGPSGAGKTTIFLRLSQNGDASKQHPALTTVASMQPNESKVILSGHGNANSNSTSNVHVVDIPGHPRLKGFFDSYVNRARGIVFVIDSVNFKPKNSEAAEQLYDVLVHPVVAGRRIPILIACNKVDEGPRAHTVDFIRKRLEKEMDELRGTRGPLEGGDVVPALSKVPFTFEGYWKPLRTKKGQPHRVTFAAVSALDVGGLMEVERFIERYIH